MKINYLNKRAVALVLTGTVLLTSMVGCAKKEENKDINSTEITTTFDKEKEKVNYTEKSIQTLFPKMNQEIVESATLITLLEELAPEDENGKISSEVFSSFKSKIDSDNMMDEFNAFLTVLESTMIEENKLIRLSGVLPKEMNIDSLILFNVENIVEKIINSNNKEEIVTEFNKLYTLFVEEDNLKVENFEFEIRDLDYSTRAIAQAYARVGAYFARNYITEEQYSKMDGRTNDQNNKAYIKTILEILSNQMEEKSSFDVVGEFENKYTSAKKLLENKVNINEESQKNLVNYLNLKLLDSDQVSNKDKNAILVEAEYEDSKVNDVIVSIDAINEYNINNQNKMITFSNLLLDQHKNTELGQTDTIALNFVQYNSLMLLNTTSAESTFTEIYNNPYFQNIYKYFTKQNFTHKYKNDKGEVVEQNIIWQGISDGVNFVNNETILYTLNKLPKVNSMDSFIKISQQNLEQSIQYIQNTIMDECEKVDADEFVKVK